MAPKTRKKKATRSKGGLLTLSEVSKRTGISMPTLQRYKKLYQERIPSEGEGRKQRYPASSLPIFKEIKKENIGKRGRPRKSEGAKQAVPPKKPRKAAAGRKATAKAAAGARAQAASGDLLTLSTVSDMTGISYPTLVRYKKLHLKRLPHEGKGRNIRFHPEAVEVFQELRSQSKRGARKKTARRGRPPAAAPAATRTAKASKAESTASDKRMKDLEKALGKLQKKFDSLLNKLKRAIG